MDFSRQYRKPGAEPMITLYDHLNFFVNLKSKVLFFQRKGKYIFNCRV